MPLPDLIFSESNNREIMQRILEIRTQDQVFVRGSASIPLLSHVTNAADSLLPLQNALENNFQRWIMEEALDANEEIYHVFQTLFEMIANAHDALVDRYPDGGPNGGVEEVGINYRIDHIRRRIRVIVADHGAGIRAASSREKERHSKRYLG
jgi:C4-dicarboxylate-specific signal transduction histidine kinase